MKNRIIVSIFLLCVFLCSCSSSKPVVEVTTEPTTEPNPTQIYLIPNSYFEYTGSDVEESADSYRNLGAEYCTRAEATDQGLEVELTEAQRDRMVQRNKVFLGKLMTDYFNENELYSYDPDDTYRMLRFYFDEKLSVEAELQGVFGAISVYGLNQILLYNEPDWSVDVVVYNCHTGKVVVSMKVPDQTVFFGEEEWRRSYEE